MITLLLATVLLGQGPDPVVLRAGRFALTRSDVAVRATEIARQAPATSADALVDMITNECLLAEDLHASGAATQPTARIAVKNAQQAVLAAATVEREIARDATPTDAQVRALFHHLNDSADIHLLVLGSRQDADAARQRLMAGGDFALEASKSFHRESAEARGNAGTLMRRSMEPSLADAVFTAPVGTLAGPIALRVGWAVARIDKLNIADEGAFADARAMLTALARQQLVAAKKQHVLVARRAQSKAAIDEAFLKGLGKRIEPTPAEATHPLAVLDGKPIEYREVLARVRSLSGGRASSHLSGPAVKIQVATQFLEERLLAEMGRSIGLDKIPEVAAALRRAEIVALAGVALDLIRASAGANPTRSQVDDAVRARLTQVRTVVGVELDRPAILKALGARP